MNTGLTSHSLLLHTAVLWRISVFLSKVGLKTAALRDVGTGANQIPDMSAFASSFGANSTVSSWYREPSGLLVQFGSIASTDVGMLTVNLPIPFTEKILSYSASKSNGYFTAVIANNTDVGMGLSSIKLGCINQTGQYGGDRIFWEVKGI